MTSKLILGFLNGADTLRFSNHSQVCDALLLSVGKKKFFERLYELQFSALLEARRSIQELLRAVIHSYTSRLNGDASAASDSDRCLVATRGVKQFFVDLDPLLKVDHPFVKTVHVRLCTRASRLPRTRQRHLGRRSLCEVLSASILHPLHV